MGEVSHTLPVAVKDNVSSSIAVFGDALSVAGKNVFYNNLKKIITIVCLICGLVFVNPAIAAKSCGWPGPESLAAVIPVAAADGSYASGVIVSQNRVLTAAHAISSGIEVFVGIHTGFRLARVLHRDTVNDLAILAVNTDNIRPLAISLDEPHISQQVWAVGFPRAQAKTTSAGVMQRMSQGALHTSAPIDSGQSGGGLLLCHNGSYVLAGMLRGYGAYRDGDEYVKLANHSVSVAAATIQRFFDLPSTFQ